MVSLTKRLLVWKMADVVEKTLILILLLLLLKKKKKWIAKQMGKVWLPSLPLKRKELGGEG